jgi:hypothetical protein
MGATNRVRTGVVVPACQATQPSGIDSLESILGLLKSLKILALNRPFIWEFLSRRGAVCGMGRSICQCVRGYLVDSL